MAHGFLLDRVACVRAMAFAGGSVCSIRCHLLRVFWLIGSRFLVAAKAVAQATRGGIRPMQLNSTIPNHLLHECQVHVEQECTATVGNIRC